MTEEQIEVRAERRMDALDRRYLSSGMTDAEYKREVAALDRETWNQIQALGRKS